MISYVIILLIPSKPKSKKSTIWLIQQKVDNFVLQYSYSAICNDDQIYQRIFSIIYNALKYFLHMNYMFNNTGNYRFIFLFFLDLHSDIPKECYQQDLSMIPSLQLLWLDKIEEPLELWVQCVLKLALDDFERQRERW